jgi:hypothetical protein
MSRILALATLAAGLVLALTLAPGVGAAKLVDRGHDSGTDTFADNVCGIDGTTTVRFVDNFQEFANNTFNDQFKLDQTFTSAATGKSVLIHAANQASGPTTRSTTATARSRSPSSSRGFRSRSSCRTAAFSHATRGT